MKTIRVAIAVIVNSAGEVLLTQRYDPSHPSTHLKWQLPGGEIEKNETESLACIREAKEETGLTIKLTGPTNTIISVNESRTYELYGFLAKAISGTIDTAKDKETADARWYKVAEITSLQTLDDTFEMIKNLF